MYDFNSVTRTSILVYSYFPTYRRTFTSHIQKSKCTQKEYILHKRQEIYFLSVGTEHFIVLRLYLHGWKCIIFASRTDEVWDEKKNDSYVIKVQWKNENN